MINQLRQYWVLIIAGVVLSLIIFSTLQDVQNANDGNLIYTLDDAYIHMAIARHMVEDGMWGMTPHAFTSNSSSLLWTGSVTFVYIFTGAAEWVPFALNVLIAFGLLGFADWAMRRGEVPGYFRLLVLLTLIHYTPLNMIIFMGMEHLLHALLTVVFVYLAAEVIGKEIPFRHPMSYALIVSAVFVPAARYEGFFIVGIACLMLLIQKRWRFAIGLGVAAASITVVFGLIAMSNGWHPVPVSILLKTLGQQSALSSIDSIPDALNFVKGAYNTLIPYPIFVQGVLLASLVLTIIAFRERTLWHPTAVMMILLGSGLMIHFRLIGDVGAFDRYAVYLFILLVFALGYAAGTLLPRRLERSLLPLLILLIPAFFYTTGHLHVRRDFLVNRYPIDGSSNDIYTQQYQMGRFISMYYSGEAVILNDIGAVSFLADIRLVDYFGLGTLEVAENRLQNEYGVLERDTMNRVIAEYDAQIAFAYGGWLFQFVEDGVPEEWAHVGTWTIEDTHIVGDGNVLIYAVTPEAVPELIANLQAMKDLLPARVYQHGMYINQLGE